MAGKSSSKHQKDMYSLYNSNGTYAKNKKAQLERHLKNHPEDAIAKAALKNISSETRRGGYSGPTKGMGTRASDRLYAQLSAEVRSMERVRKFIKSPATVVLKNNEIYTPERLFEELGIRPTEQKAQQNGKAKKVRRGGRRTKQANAA